MLTFTPNANKTLCIYNSVVKFNNGDLVIPSGYSWCAFGVDVLKILDFDMKKNMKLKTRRNTIVILRLSMMKKVRVPQ